MYHWITFTLKHIPELHFEVLGSFRSKHYYYYYAFSSTNSSLNTHLIDPNFLFFISDFNETSQQLRAASVSVVAAYSSAHKRTHASSPNQPNMHPTTRNCTLQTDLIPFKFKSNLFFVYANQETMTIYANQPMQLIYT